MTGSNGSNGSDRAASVSGSASVPTAPFAVCDDLGRPIFWPYGDAAQPGTAAPPNPGSELVNLRFLGAAIGRGKRIWLTLAVIGLLIGCGLFATAHSSYSASVSILLSEDPQGEIGGISTEALLARNPTVAASAIRELGLSMTPQAFLGTYSADLEPLTTSTNISNSNNVINSPVLVIAATADTATQATREANAVTAEFLKYRTRMLNSEAAATYGSAARQIATDRNTLASLQAQVSAVSAEKKSAARQQRLSKLRSEERTAASALSAAEKDVGSAESATQLTVSTMISGTQVLSSTPAALTVSHTLTALEYIGSPFVGGLMIGLAIVVVGAVTSNRPRRRDDIAAALGSPVKLSVSAYASGSPLTSGAGRNRRAEVDVRRIVAYLKSVLEGATHRPATLAVIAVDNSGAVLPLVKALAFSLVAERTRVTLADLSDRILARELGKDRPGVHGVRMQSAGVLLVVPDIGRELETGPLGRVDSGGAGHTAVAAAYASADVVLVAASFDPALGGEYTATWATEAVVVITAGASSAEKIQSVGEMLRAAKVHVHSAVVLGADSDDESWGHVRADLMREG